ncbi:hypothetical protein [Desulfuribacillus alkaliarsenatis]|uniref:Uncharacterized protein n=1 Tax=Desulfuribacillus alkaliarsenatis TaxID=766136 RepID=A0A1E5G257_9FIRM|nr:hypothetical protein [Desulfuribacillus alkaliarsenatis]OEF96983.1 hypothetical protein BHF68_05100 [Desulfuribacillus alkaliarsenatis]
MKKMLIVLMIVSLTLLSLIGCSSSKYANSQTEEEMREQIRAELEAQQQSPSNTTMNQDTEYMDKVFQFITSEYPEYTREDFDKWDYFSLDITCDGTDEIILSTTYWDGKLERAIVIMDDQGQLSEIPSYIPLAKYENNFEMKDGFLVHKTKSGGPGAHYYHMNLYIHHDSYSYLLNTLDSSILIEETVSAPMEDYQTKGEIKGTLKDFVIEYTKTDNQTDVEEIIAKDSYRFDTGVLFFWKKPISISNTAKNFEQVFNGNNLYETIEYFYNNLYQFDDNSREDFSIKLMNAIDQDLLKILPMGDLPYISDDAYNIATNELDLSMIGEYAKDSLEYINNSRVYQLAKLFYADDGEVVEGGIGLTFDYWTFQMLKPALNYAYPDRHSPFEYNDLHPIIAPHFIFYSVEQVENTHIGYLNILVYSYDDVKKLEGANTWKDILLLPVEVVGY